MVSTLYSFIFTSTGVEYYLDKVEIKLADISSEPPKTSIQDRYTVAGTEFPENLEELAFRRSRSQRHTLLHRPERVVEIQRQLRDWNSPDRKAQFGKILRLLEQMQCVFDGYVGVKSHLRQLVARVRNTAVQSPSGTVGRIRAMWYFEKILTGTVLRPM